MVNLVDIHIYIYIDQNIDRYQIQDSSKDILHNILHSIHYNPLYPLALDRYPYRSRSPRYTPT